MALLQSVGEWVHIYSAYGRPLPGSRVPGHRSRTEGHPDLRKETLGCSLCHLKTIESGDMIEIGSVRFLLLSIIACGIIKSAILQFLLIFSSNTITCTSFSVFGNYNEKDEMFHV